MVIFPYRYTAHTITNTGYLPVQIHNPYNNYHWLSSVTDAQPINNLHWLSSLTDAQPVQSLNLVFLHTDAQPLQ